MEKNYQKKKELLREYISHYIHQLLWDYKYRKKDNRQWVGWRADTPYKIAADDETPNKQIDLVEFLTREAKDFINPFFVKEFMEYVEDRYMAHIDRADPMSGLLFMEKELKVAGVNIDEKRKSYHHIWNLDSYVDDLYYTLKSIINKEGDDIINSVLSDNTKNMEQIALYFGEYIMYYPPYGYTIMETYLHNEYKFNNDTNNAAVERRNKEDKLGKYYLD